MKHLLIVIVLLLLPASNQKVYICTGSSSRCYHKTSTCYGLNNCKGEIKKITLEEAQRMGRRECGICYKR